MQWTNRQDSRTSDLINQAVVMDAVGGAVRAWTHLVKAGLPEEVIFRVLSQPSRRRVPYSVSADQTGVGPGAD
jgi:hypothetical protein